MENHSYERHVIHFRERSEEIICSLEIASLCRQLWISNRRDEMVIVMGSYSATGGTADLPRHDGRTGLLPVPGP